MTLDTVLLAYIVIIGFCVGSFLNVVILRAFSGESIVLPASKCPQCENKLKWYDNIPIISFLVLKGKCRFCNEKISIQYPIVELITGILFAAVYIKFGLSVNAVFMFILFSLGIVITVTDLKEKVVFDMHTIMFIVIAILFNLINGTIIASLIGLLVGTIVMEALARAGYLFVKKRAFGEGDTLIAAGIGALLGFKLFFAVLALSVIVQVITILPSFLTKMWKNNHQKLVIFISIFVVSVAVYKILMFKSVMHPVLQIILLLLIVVFGIMSCLNLFKITKTSEELNYLPFGPALLIMTMAVVLWAKPIVGFLKLIY